MPSLRRKSTPRFADAPSIMPYSSSGGSNHFACEQRRWRNRTIYYVSAIDRCSDKSLARASFGRERNRSPLLCFKLLCHMILHGNLVWKTQPKYLPHRADHLSFDLKQLKSQHYLASPTLVERLCLQNGRHRDQNWSPALHLMMPW